MSIASEESLEGMTIRGGITREKGRNSLYTSCVRGGIQTSSLPLVTWTENDQRPSVREHFIEPVEDMKCSCQSKTLIGSLHSIDREIKGLLLTSRINFHVCYCSNEYQNMR